MMKPKWFMVERGKRWRYCLGERTLGVVVWNFFGWDAYVLLDKYKRSVHYYSPTVSNTCWEARRAVENAIADLEKERACTASDKSGTVLLAQ